MQPVEGKTESVMRAINFTLDWNSRAFPNKADLTEIISVHLMSTEKKKKDSLGPGEKTLGTKNYTTESWAELKQIWKITEKAE